MNDAGEVTLRARLARDGDALFAAVWLVAAVLFGGGADNHADLLLALPALLYLALTWRRPASALARGLPVAVLALPVLQLIPLPPAWFHALPGRAALLAGYREAGVTAGWHAASLNPFATERALLFLVVPVAVYWAALALTRAAQRRLLTLMVVVGLLSAVLGLAQVVGGPGSPLYFYENTNRGEAVGFFANRNHLAALLVVLVPVAAGLLADRLRRVSRMLDPTALLLAVGLAFLFVGVTATHSRAGLGLLMLAVGAVAALLLPEGRHRAPAVHERVRRWMRWVLVIGIAVAIQYELVGLLRRLAHDPLDDYRWLFARRTLEAARPYAGWGAGLGVFPDGYYGLGESAMELPVLVNHAHDDFLELWFDGGLLALGLALGLVVLAAVLLVRRLRESTEMAAGTPRAEEGTAVPPRRRGARDPVRGLLFGAGLVPLLLALHSLADYPLRTLALASFGAFCLGVMLASPVSAAPRSD